MKTLMLLTLALFVVAMGYEDPNEATYAGCAQTRGGQTMRTQNGFAPGLYVTTSNLPGATWNADGSVAKEKVVCAHQDQRTTGGSVIIPWAQFDKQTSQGSGYFDWDFIDEQMKPWIDRGQMVNLLVWPAVQKRDQLFPTGASATPDYVMNQAGMTYQCPDGSAQGGVSEGIPLPMFWKPEVYLKYAQALKQLVKRYQDHPNVNYFRFGIGVGAESYPGNGATTPDNYCMDTFVNQFEGDTYEDRAVQAYNTWTDYVRKCVRAFRQFNSKKPIVVTINDFYTLPSIDKSDFPNMIAYEALRSFRANGTETPKLGLGVQGATTGGIDQHSTNTECYADWCDIFNDKKDLGIPLQLQTPLHSGVNGRPGSWQTFPECQTSRKNNGRYGCTNTGNLSELLDFALSMGVNSFELYPYEWIVANDDTWDNNPPELNWHEVYGQQYGETLDKASNQQLVQ